MTGTNQAMKRPFREKHSFSIILTLLALVALTAFASYTIFAVPLLLAVVLLGLDIAKVNVRGIVKCHAAKTWPTTHATLIRGSSDRRRYDGTKHGWYLDIEYQYSVEGKQYKDTNYNWVGKMSESKETIERLIEDLKQHQGFRIRFNPVNHSESVVVPNFSLIYVAGILVGTLFVVGGTLGILNYFGIVAMD